MRNVRELIVYVDILSMLMSLKCCISAMCTSMCMRLT
jgi:hypothetical protein